MANKFETFRDFYLKVREYLRLEDQDILTVDENRDMANLRDDIDRELEAFTKYDVALLPFTEDSKVVKIGGRHIPVSAIRSLIDGSIVLIVTQEEADGLKEQLDPLIQKINDEVGVIERSLNTTKAQKNTYSREERS